MKRTLWSATVLMTILALLIFSTGWLQDLVQIASLVVMLSVYSLFISSLWPNKTPLISRYAILMEPEISEQELRYTRKVTWAWVLLLSMLFIEKTGIVLFNTEWWFLGYYLNNYLEVIFMLGSAFLFIGELYLRRWIFPEKTHDSLKQFFQKITHISLQDIWKFKRSEFK
ncbi:hypothetical protein P8629_01170 [Hydrogenovibrio sp. 3SP14C1]|uniref:hypothetical protein n=1 Tax=Hydrogenovibrio sp. 3SP14C1 TaxID=3038774 RepID=UPI0024162435|nr:hypothetical protein [Hydrogenovibrio sp. 3SP14C1]MDG4811605.1 hypothetical protein [Hydrogenovibrio sp. 3SP14C1]